ncbi:MAG: hypothetical protein ACI4JC_10280 [Faecalibacterium sp.]
MELFELNSLKMPVECCILSEEEMTYTYGGAEEQNVSVSQVIAGLVGSVAMNLAYVMGSAFFSQTLSNAKNGYKDGLSLGQSVQHFWSSQSPAGKVATVVMSGLSGFYLGVQAYNLYMDLMSLVTPVEQPAEAVPAAA